MTRTPRDRDWMNRLFTSEFSRALEMVAACHDREVIRIAAIAADREGRDPRLAEVLHQRWMALVVQ